MKGITKSTSVSLLRAGHLTFGLVLVFCTLAGVGQAQSFKRSEIRMLGSLDYGQISAAARLTGKPAYSAYAFNGRPGDHIEITVQGQGALQAVLTDAEFRKLAGGSAHFSYTFDPASQPGTNYIVISEAHHRTARFTVELERPSITAGSSPDAGGPDGAVTPEYLACAADADCIAVERAGCCHNGYKDAVNAHLVEQYLAANACQDPHHMCPMFRIVDKRVARCQTSLKRCVLVNP